MDLKIPEHRRFRLYTVLFASLFIVVNACGPTTHIEISYRSLYKYLDVHGSTSYDAILRQNQDALEAGNTFPDAFYPSICYNGQFHQVAEDTHWTPFTNASVHYIRKHYPQPYNKDAQKLISFLMGVVSHQVADISWHSIGGIPQGFLKTMSYVNYHGVYNTAHHDGDLGGDVLNLYQLDLTYSKIVGEWYVPVEDLLGIYQELYNGNSNMTKDVVEACTTLSYVVKIAERLAVGKYFPISAKHSPYLVNQLYDYFLGGMEDMVVWTQRIWKYVTWALENGTQQCNLEYNPLLLRCNETSNLMTSKKNSASHKNGFFVEPHPEILKLVNDVVVKRTSKGIAFQPSDKLKRKLLKAASQSGDSDSHHWKAKAKTNELQKRNKFVANMEASEDETFGPKETKPSAIFHTNVAYAKLGDAYAVADLDGDGNDDVVIGAPGFYSPQNQQNGMVFVLFGTDNGLKTSVPDIVTAADIQIPGPQNEHSAASKFGSSLAIVDLDKDGNLDIAVGAPSFGSTEVTYTGRIFIYSLVGKTGYTLKSTVTCKDLYCNLGKYLTTLDVNSDLANDLVVGSHFAAGPQGEQKGMTSVVNSDDSYKGRSDIWLDVTESANTLYGNQNYSWFGYSLEAMTSHDGTLDYLAVGEPNFRNCSKPDCEYDPADVQAIGKVNLYTSESGRLTKLHEFLGDKEFAMLGTSLSMGRPFDKISDIVAISASSRCTKGLVEFAHVDLPQVGSVFLFNLSNPSQYRTIFSGDRRYGRFGAHIKFADLDKDGFDELIIGAPLRTNDFTGELFGVQQGKVYIYKGGPSFPVGDATAHCGGLVDIEPCPAHRAWHVLTYGENMARFGSQLAVVKSKNKVNLLVTAAHSSLQSRLGGTVAVFDF